MEVHEALLSEVSEAYPVMLEDEQEVLSLWSVHHVYENASRVLTMRKGFVCW
jgi:hypothetical protein